ncbi:unnamed protein product [Umbelopsis ramanniana]
MLIKSAIALTVMALWSSVASSPIQMVKRESSPITWDSYSLKIDGERVFWRAGELAPWRLPSPALWKDVFEKMKANGYNVAQMYFHWGYHSWNNQTVDFTGIRDIDEMMRMANETGIYVSARPGPYINAETTSGGLAEWTRTLKGAARTDAADYTAAWKPYIEGVAKILAKWQYPEGPVIAVQIENEFGDTTTAARNYMALLEQAYTDNGIYVPNFHNAASDYASPWISGKGATDMIGYDFYPIGWGPCPADPTVWTQPYSTPFAEIVKYKQDVPLFIPELGAGAYDT